MRQDDLPRLVRAEPGSAPEDATSLSAVPHHSAAPYLEPESEASLRAAHFRRRDVALRCRHRQQGLQYQEQVSRLDAVHR